MLYWPMAIVTDVQSKKTYTQFTYDGCLTFDAAKDVINRWKDNTNILVLCAYIQADNKVIYLENNLNFLGNVEYNHDDPKQKRK
jgi:hypothetical protein